jgi:tetratricopeptide (TPR) repeat protein
MSKMDFEELFRKGTQLLHQGKVTEARPLLEQAYKQDPEHLDAALNLSGVYILTKKFRRAVAILEPLSERIPDEAAIWTNFGAAYLGNPVLARGEEQLQAIAAFEKALTANPVAPHVAYNIGLIYRDREEVKKAIFWFKKAIQTNPNDRDARNLLRSLKN